MATVERTTSIPTSRSESEVTQAIATRAGSKTASVDVQFLHDPDLLIREYFVFSTPVQRVRLRGSVAKNVTGFKAILKIIEYGRQTNIADAYDACIDLLAEFDSLELHQQAVQYLEATSHLYCRSSKSAVIALLEASWELLIKGIACAYKTSPQERFNIVSPLSQVSQRRIVKAAVIDALVTIADDLDDMQPIINTLGQYTATQEQDDYIRRYAEEAIQDLV